MKECCDRHHGIRCENIYFAKQTHVMMYDVCTLHDEDMRTSKRSVGREGETGKKVVNNFKSRGGWLSILATLPGGRRLFWNTDLWMHGLSADL